MAVLQSCLRTPGVGPNLRRPQDTAHLLRGLNPCTKKIEKSVRVKRSNMYDNQQKLLFSSPGYDILTQ